MNVDTVATAADLGGLAAGPALTNIARRKREPRRSVAQREIAAYERGYEAGQEFGSVRTIPLLLMGAGSGALSITIIFVIFHRAFFG